MVSQASKGRRSFLTLLTGVGGAAIGAVLAIPGVAYVVDPLLRAGGKKGQWVKLTDLDALDREHPVPIPVVGEHRDAWTRSDSSRLGVVWIRKKGEQAVAFSAECPHLGCKVGYDKSTKAFACPCHDSKFSFEGERLGGPAPRGLDPLETRVVDGTVEVRFVRFRAQVPEREEIA